MCGISGIVALNGRSIDPAVLQIMTDLQAHRGPDGEGFLLAWRQAGEFDHAALRHTSQWDGQASVEVAFGHRRLAILDLSDRGWNPMGANGGRCWIVFNGEIYNHRELRAELESLGHAFVTRTDTEVLLHAYLAWGEDCLERLEGMYAFAIWDGVRGRVFCARDRLGIKPFYYAALPGYVIFASEVKALLAFPGLAARADDAAVLGFLVHGNCDYGEQTVLQDVKALPAAHSLTIDLRNGTRSTRQYWQLLPRPANGTRPQEAAAQLRELLIDSTCKHLISDVRAGSCLSGGLDSSTVVSLIGKLWREQPHNATAIGDSFYTFTSCYRYRELDEREYALSAASAVGATPHLVFPSAEDFWEVFPRLAWHQDMPFASLSYYAQWRVMRAAREAGVKVLLDGQGGDEVFAGYAKFRYAYLASLLRRGNIVRWTREVGATLLHGDPYVLDLRKGYRYLPRSLRRLLRVDSLLQRVLRADWDKTLSAESTPATRWWRYASGRAADEFAGTAVQRMQVDDIVVDTLPQLLRHEDRSSMAFSLEARVPLLDHRVVEFGVSLPDRLKVHNGWSKYAVRRAMDGLMPETLRWRKTKLGFAAPDRRWLAQELRPQVTELLADSLRCERYVDPAELRRWYGSAAAARANTEAYLGLFRVLALEMWMRAFSIN